MFFISPYHQLYLNSLQSLLLSLGNFLFQVLKLNSFLDSLDFRGMHGLKMCFVVFRVLCYPSYYMKQYFTLFCMCCRYDIRLTQPF